MAEQAYLHMESFVAEMVWYVASIITSIHHTCFLASLFCSAEDLWLLLYAFELSLFILMLYDECMHMYEVCSTLNFVSKLKLLQSFDILL